MSLAVTLRIALNALRLNMLRSGLTMLGIVIGVAAVIVMVAMGAGARQRIEEQIRSFGANLMVVRPGITTSSGVRLPEDAGSRLTEDDAAAIATEVAGVRVAVPILRGNGQLVASSSNWAATVFGITPDYFEAREWPLSDGRIFSGEEMSAAARVAVLGRTVARELFGGNDAVGQGVRINNVPFVVIGVLQEKGQSVFGYDQDDIVLLPITTARMRLFGNPQGKLRRVSSITVKTFDEGDMAQVEQDIRALLRQRQRTRPDQDDRFSIRNLNEMLQAEQESSHVMTVLLASIASISLLVGGIGIMNIMLVSVTERTREIGLRMAVGARPQDILVQFLVESVTLSVIGGLAGIALGAGGAALVSWIADLPASVSLSAVLLASGVSAVIGIFFGFYPARRASRMLPIQALRHE